MNKKEYIFEDLNQKIKLKQARLNLLDFINTVWYNNSIITKNIIINGFNKAGIINKYYTSEEEDKISDLFVRDLIDERSYEIVDDLSIELNVNMNNLENEEEDEIDKESSNDIEIEEDIIIFPDIDDIDNNLKQKIEELEKEFKNKINEPMDLD